MQTRPAAALPAVLALAVAAYAHAGGSSALRAEAERCAAALTAVALPEAVRCLNPKLVAAMGGPGAAGRTLEKRQAAMAADGATIQSLFIGRPGPEITIGPRVFALVPQTLTLRVREGVRKQSAQLLAIRDADSAAWTFIDASGASPEKLSALFPDTRAEEFRRSLPIPPRKPPELQR